MSKPHRQLIPSETRSNCDRASIRQRRRGMTSMELLVSVVILTATVSVITTLIYKCGMIWKDVSQRRVAVHELATQLETLTLLDKDSASERLEQLKLSSICTDRLPDAKLTGVMSKDNLGARIQLSLNWKRSVESKPVILCGWIVEPEEAQ